MTNPLLQLAECGQSIWLDFLRRGLIQSGELAGFIRNDGLRGVTSNPSIFEKSIAGSKDYDEAIQRLARAGKPAAEIYDELATTDIRAAADLFRPVYDELDGRDGFISLEVSPDLAHDARATVSEARRLWAEVNRPNILIKIPATREGLPAIETCIREGINVNVTLLFGLPRYRQVTEAYLAGLEGRLQDGREIGRIASVASFFLSRIDVLVDPILEKIAKHDARRAARARALLGRVAIASAKDAYQIYKETFAAERFRRLAARGARPQRVLWASTSTKNPSYSDVKYVEALIGPETVNTAPLETLQAYRDHGRPAARLEQDLEAARQTLARLSELDIDLDGLTQQLEDEGVAKFAKAFRRLMEALERKRAAASTRAAEAMEAALGRGQKAVGERLQRLQQENFGQRLWKKDTTLWKAGAHEAEVIRGGLGWLDVAEKMEDGWPALQAFAEEVRRSGYQHVLHMGMGGSSLAPLVLARTFGAQRGGLPVTVLDTTHADTIRDLTEQLPLLQTLFIMASKSGTTTEARAFGDYFYERVARSKGASAGRSFVAITDPRSPLAELASARGFRQTFLNFPDIGGRYSALSYFGLVPAALMGLPADELLRRAQQMAQACSASAPAQDNPGLYLGTVLAEMALAGRDKVTFVLPESIASLGLWLEQLLAESTGKEGRGLIPVAGEPWLEAKAYGSDRLFVAALLEEEDDPALLARIQALKAAGHPVVQIRLSDRYDLAQEFFRWEVATATAGSILGINAFDQPNVQESKDNTRRLLERLRAEKRLPEEAPVLTEEGLAAYAAPQGESIAEILARFLGQTESGDYVALLVYLPETDATGNALQNLRASLQQALRTTTTLGYGPRYLHSTGQLHKGGPNTGLFLQLTGESAVEAAIPGAGYGFQDLARAQALGDLQALRQHGRRVMRIDLGREVARGLANLESAVQQGLGALRGKHAG